MKAFKSQMLAVLLTLSGVLSMAPAFSQLPNCNMGKWVHQPGDNQYNVQAQQQRHQTYIDRTGPGQSVYIARPAGGGDGGGGGGSAAVSAATHMQLLNPMVLMYTMTPKVDISVEPIATDEPVPPSGFPPLPDHVSLPIALGAGGAGGSWANNSGHGRGGGGGSGGGGGGSGGGGGGGGGAPSYEGMHQHYAHFAPGTFAGQGGGGGGGSGGGGGGGSGYAANPDSAVPGVTGGGGGGEGGGGGGGGAVASNGGGGGGGTVRSHGYYKCTESGPLSKDSGAASMGDRFSSGGGPGGSGIPRYTGASTRDLKALGDEPKLDDGQDAKAAAPEAPQAAIVSQSQPTDLSLPDDDFVSRYAMKDNGLKRFGRYTMYNVGNMIWGQMGRVYSIIP